LVEGVCCRPGAWRIFGGGDAWLPLLPLWEKVSPKATDEGCCTPFRRKEMRIGAGSAASRFFQHPSSDLASLGHLLPQGDL
jgi:hypothetical protein